jgi:hypothetical protein
MKTSTDISEPEWRPREKTYPNLIVLNVLTRVYSMINTRNVVIVVTKALIFWSDYDDLEPKYEKGKQWGRDAKGKTRIKKLVVE